MEDRKPGKVRKATALAYEPGADKAPKIIATGRGEIADGIIQTAREADVPVYEDAHLADVLGTLKLGTEIPQELYEVVAEVLAFVSRMDEQAMTRRRTSLAERMSAQDKFGAQGQPDTQARPGAQARPGEKTRSGAQARPDRQGRR